MKNQGQQAFTIVIRAAFMKKTANEVALGRKRRIHPVPEAKPDHDAVSPAFPGTLREMARATSQEIHVVLRECILL
jgi:hypothetical protein